MQFSIELDDGNSVVVTSDEICSIKVDFARRRYVVYLENDDLPKISVALGSKGAEDLETALGLECLPTFFLTFR
jgi:hypothetical protein